MINLLDIVYCFVSKTIPFKGDIASLRASFIKNGFTEKEISGNHWQYKRGTVLGLDFKYTSSEAMEMLVFLKLSSDELTIRVGNWGFPFEPLLMKKRFIRSLERFSDEITSNGTLFVNNEEIKNIESQSQNKFKYAIIVIVFLLIFGLSFEVFISLYL
jgi:hypothetical protein